MKTDDDIFDGPDANQIRRHAKRMHTELEYRKLYCKLDFYKPHDKQRLAHNNPARFLAVRAGNQSGKSQWGAAQVAMDALGRYPRWYSGRKFLTPPAIERPHKFIAWCASPTSVTTRDVLQMKLFGDVSAQGGLGQGLIPLDAMTGHKLVMSRGISNFIDTAVLNRDTGGTAAIAFKSYEMDRAAYQGQAVDVVHLDEDMGYSAEIFDESTARLTATGGRLLWTATPILGLTPMRKFWREAEHPDRSEVRFSVFDNPYIPAAELEALKTRYKESERRTRLYGDDMHGMGRVFDIDPEAVKHRRDPATIPTFWRWIAAVDFSHGGMSSQAHPFAWVVCTYDPDNRVLYVMDALRLRQMLPLQHVAAIKNNPMWDAPTAWGADGYQRELSTGASFAGTYKSLGLRMLPQHAQLEKGGVSLEAAIAEMEGMFMSGRIKIAAHLTELFEELEQYHRDETLKVVAQDDDLISALRYAVMSLRFAKIMDAEREAPPGWTPGNYSRRRGGQQVARGTAARDDFDIWTGE